MARVAVAPAARFCNQRGHMRDIDPEPPALLPGTPHGVEAAAVILRGGGLVGFPTETVYGLGTDARSDAAVARLYAAKGRPRFNPLIAHAGSLDAARRLGVLTQEALALAEAFWPGPLTLVVPVRPDGDVGLLARAGLDSVGLRVPAHPLARALLDRCGFPVAAPSANRSGRVSPTTAAHVRDEFAGGVEAVLDGGPCAVGLESTIVSCLGPAALLRPGGLPRAAVEAVLGHPLPSASGVADAPLAPGLLASHYAPRARLRLDALQVSDGEAVLDFAGRLRGRGRADARLDLSRAGDLAEAAASLFAALRRLDATGAPVIAVARVPDHGLGEAINDRLRRAAAPRP